MTNRSSPRSAVLLYGAAFLAVMLVAGASFLASRELHRRAFTNVEQQAIRFIGGAQAALNRTVLGVDVLLAGVGELVPRTAELKGRDGRDRASRLMDMGVDQNPLVQRLFLISADGGVLVSSGEHGRGSSPKLPLSESYLESIFAEKISSLFIGEPVVSQATSRPVLHFARALRLPDGNRVVVVAELDIALLMNILVQGADIGGLEVTVERESGLLLASTPAGLVPGERRQVSALGPRREDASFFLGPARLSAVPAVVVARPCLQTQMLVTGSIPLSSALADSRRERNVIFGIGGVVAAALVLGAMFLRQRLLRQWTERMERQRSRATLDQALESMQVGFVLLDADERMLVWNRSFHDIFPRAKDLTGLDRPFRPIADLTAQYRRLPAAANAPDRKQEQEEELVLPDGRVIRSTKNRTPDGGLVCIYQDVTEKKRYTAQLLEGRAQLQATLDALPDTLLELDRNGICLRFHAPQGQGAIAADVGPVGRRIGEMLPAPAAEQVMQAIREAGASGGTGRRRVRQFELAVKGMSESPRFFEVLVSRKPTEGTERPSYIVILRDITQAELATRHIQQLAFYDVLTGLPNRRLLLDLMEGAVRIEPGSGRHGALLFLDLDNFKMLNDALGHAMGDLLLKEAAARISLHVRPGDVVARLGGDEFVVMLENLGEGREAARSQVRVVGERIIDALNVPFRLDTATTYHRTCSLGIALFDGGERSIEEILKQADIAMYVAKTAGGNALRFFEPEMQAEVAARSVLENELSEALAAHQFLLYYQTQVDGSGATVGVEALVRWQHPQRGLVLPGEFISVAEDTELIVPLGLQVLEMACAQLAAWRGVPGRSQLEIAVNVSARQFRRDDFADEVEKAIAVSGADPGLLKLELTESLLQSHVPETIRKMQRLKSLGIRFSMDDFGIGYSSLSYLTQLPLDQLKIDKYFVGGIGVDPKIETIVQTIIGMARNLDVELIAEGVETEQQRIFLEKHGCTRFQGFLFSRPVPIADFERKTM
ncbi:bifunctional diguanylate cyclase/phosphodiesterase [Variovorax sp. RHLX14]|uniref:bifunctional diguanylate cyclase/phosphodiesterase n=1 Tax=Variovorax sp. RHLX14 TaxID=1259731 RepID=UPI003F47C357